MFKQGWRDIHVLELIAVFLVLCTVALYAKAYLDFEHNYQTWLTSTGDGAGMSRAEALGLSGDFLGGVLNPILSFFSFLALLVTLRLQRRELTSTMEELRKSTLAAEHNVQLFTEQIAAQRLDAFENTFFALLRVFNSTFEKINTPLPVLPPGMGSAPHMHHQGTPLQTLMAQAREESTLEHARGVLMADHSEIDHFISILFEMLKFIDQKFPNDGHNDRMFYANVLKAIINQEAFEAIAMYAATHDAHNPFYPFKQLIEKYELLLELDLTATRHQKFVADYMQFFPPLRSMPNASA